MEGSLGGEIIVVELHYISEKLTQHLSRLDYAEKQVCDESEHLVEAEAYVKEVEKAQLIIQSVAEQIQNVVHRRLASIVTQCLHAIFGRAYDFKINFRKLRGKTEAELKLTKGDLELDPLDSTGGGVVDILSMGLRLAGLVLSRPARRKLLVLDEPFRHLSRNYSGRARNMLETLSSELGFQLIIVTHNPRLVTGKEVRL